MVKRAEMEAGVRVIQEPCVPIEPLETAKSVEKRERVKAVEARRRVPDHICPNVYPIRCLEQGGEDSRPMGRFPASFCRPRTRSLLGR